MWTSDPRHRHRTHTHTHIIQSIGFVVVHPKILNKLLETSAVFERLLHFLAPLSCFKRSPFFQFPSLAQTHNAHRHTYTSYNIHHAIIHHVCMALCMHASVRAHTQTERKTYEHIRNTQRNDPHRKAFVQTLSIPWYGYGYVPPPVLATEQWTERFNWFAQPSTDLSSSHFLWHTGNDIYIISAGAQAALRAHCTLSFSMFVGSWKTIIFRRSKMSC